MALKVAILGFGEEGQSAYRFFTSQGADITIFDEAAKPKYSPPRDVKFIHGPDCFNKVMGFDKVLRGSPAIRPDRFQTDGERTSVTKEFFARCPHRQIIGVTGTKGKGTIATLIYDILTEAGVPAHLAGNVGMPMLDVLPNVTPADIVVLELSSFQLWDLETSPHIGVVGMIEPEHLEIHKDMAEYVGAKANIAKFQSAEDTIIFHPSNEYSADIANQSAGHKIRYNTSEGAALDNGGITIDGQEVVSLSDIRIPGQHNIENITAAITAAWQVTQDREAIKRAVQQFRGLAHRLEFAQEIDGVKYYDDSISTTPGSVIAAIHAFAPEHEILIVGGAYDKGADFGELATALAAEAPKKVFFVGPLGKKIAALAQNAGYQQGEVVEQWDMHHIVQRAAKQAEAGDTVILSPATASFKDFINYKDRGQQFKEAVKGLAEL